MVNFYKKSLWRRGAALCLCVCLLAQTATTSTCEAHLVKREAGPAWAAARCALHVPFESQALATREIASFTPVGEEGLASALRRTAHSKCLDSTSHTPPVPYDIPPASPEAEARIAAQSDLFRPLGLTELQWHKILHDVSDGDRGIIAPDASLEFMSARSNKSIVIGPILLDGVRRRIQIELFEEDEDGNFPTTIISRWEVLTPITEQLQVPFWEWVIARVNTNGRLGRRTSLKKLAVKTGLIDEQARLDLIASIEKRFLAVKSADGSIDIIDRPEEDVFLPGSTVAVDKDVMIQRSVEPIAVSPTKQNKLVADIHSHGIVDSAHVLFSSSDIKLMIERSLQIGRSVPDIIIEWRHGKGRVIRQITLPEQKLNMFLALEGKEREAAISAFSLEAAKQQDQFPDLDIRELVIGEQVPETAGEPGNSEYLPAVPGRKPALTTQSSYEFGKRWGLSRRQTELLIPWWRELPRTITAAWDVWKFLIEEHSDPVRIQDGAGVPQAALNPPTPAQTNARLLGLTLIWASMLAVLSHAVSACFITGDYSGLITAPLGMLAANMTTHFIFNLFVPSAPLTTENQPESERVTQWAEQGFPSTNTRSPIDFNRFYADADYDRMATVIIERWQGFHLADLPCRIRELPAAIHTYPYEDAKSGDKRICRVFFGDAETRDSPSLAILIDRPTGRVERVAVELHEDSAAAFLEMTPTMEGFAEIKQALEHKLQGKVPEIPQGNILWVLPFIDGDRAECERTICEFPILQHVAGRLLSTSEQRVFMDRGIWGLFDIERRGIVTANYTETEVGNTIFSSFSHTPFEPKDFDAWLHEALHVLYHQAMRRGNLGEDELLQIITHIYTNHPRFHYLLFDILGYSQHSPNGIMEEITEWIAVIGHTLFQLQERQGRFLPQEGIPLAYGDILTREDRDLLVKFGFWPENASPFGASPASKGKSGATALTTQSSYEFGKRWGLSRRQTELLIPWWRELPRTITAAWDVWKFLIEEHSDPVRIQDGAGVPQAALNPPTPAQTNARLLGLTLIWASMLAVLSHAVSACFITGDYSGLITAPLGMLAANITTHFIFNLFVPSAPLTTENQPESERVTQWAEQGFPPMRAAAGEAGRATAYGARWYRPLAAWWESLGLPAVFMGLAIYFGHNTPLVTGIAGTIGLLAGLQGQHRLTEYGRAQMNGAAYKQMSKATWAAAGLMILSGALHAPWFVPFAITTALSVVHLFINTRHKSQESINFRQFYADKDYDLMAEPQIRAFTGYSPESLPEIIDHLGLSSIDTFPSEDQRSDIYRIRRVHIKASVGNPWPSLAILLNTATNAVERIAVELEAILPKRVGFVEITPSMKSFHQIKALLERELRKDIPTTTVVDYYWLWPWIESENDRLNLERIVAGDRYLRYVFTGIHSDSTSHLYLDRGSWILFQHDPRMEDPGLDANFTINTNGNTSLESINYLYFMPKNFPSLLHELMHIVFIHKIHAELITPDDLKSLFEHIRREHPGFVDTMRNTWSYQLSNSQAITAEWIAYMGKILCQHPDLPSDGRTVIASWGNLVTPRDRDWLIRLGLWPTDDSSDELSTRRQAKLHSSA